MAEFKKEIIHINNNGRKIYAAKFLPQNIDKCPIIIFSHGFNGTGDFYEKHCKFFASHGIAALYFDFCGGSVNTKSDLTTTDMTVFTEKEDLVAIISEIKKWEQIDTDNIFLFGSSQGGLVSALTADEYKDDVRGLLLQFPALCIPDDWNKMFPNLDEIPDKFEKWNIPLSKNYAVSLHGFDTFEHIGKFERAVQIFHGDKDETVPVAYGIRASKVYKNAKIEVFPGEGHGFSDESEKKVVHMCYDFIKENLKK